MILSLEDHKDITKKLLDVTKHLFKITGCKTNMQKPVGFLYTNNKLRKTSEK
jgi:hypothetical protein